MTSISEHTTDAILLAGGQGRRLQGRDKGLVPYQGRPLAAWVLDRIRPQVDRLVISANRHLDSYRQLCHCPVIADASPGYQGPLAGILSASTLTQAPWLLVVPCDVPALPQDLAARLHQARRQFDSAISMAHDGQNDQPLCLLLHRDLLSSLERYLTEGERRVRDWITQENGCRADFSHCPKAFLNLNQPAAFEP